METPRLFFKPGNGGGAEATTPPQTAASSARLLLSVVQALGQIQIGREYDLLRQACIKQRLLQAATIGPVDMGECALVVVLGVFPDTDPYRRVGEELPDESSGLVSPGLFGVAVVG